MSPQVFQPTGFDANLSPDLFRNYSRQYMDCYRAYKPTSGYSPVPYFLLCRAMELALKAHHLENKSRAAVKKDYSHNLSRLYADLPSALKCLNADQEKLLDAASDKYDIPNKGFEYVSTEDVLTGHASFPNLEALEALANRLVEHE